MEPITIAWNGPTTVEQAVETPDESMSCGQFAAAFAESHSIDGDVYLTLDCEDVPDTAPVDLLGGETVTLTLRVDEDVEPRKAPKPKAAKARKAVKKRAPKPKAAKAAEAIAGGGAFDSLSQSTVTGSSTTASPGTTSAPTTSLP